VSQVEVTIRFLKVALRNPPSEPRLTLNDFRQALQRAIDELRDLDSHGVCFLLDEAEFIVRQSWANDCWAYFRGLKDTDMAIKPFLGLVLSGYRGVAEYQQRAGSDLQNIAHVHWLNTLSEADARSLISKRASSERLHLPDTEIAGDGVGRRPSFSHTADAESRPGREPRRQIAAGREAHAPDARSARSQLLGVVERQRRDRWI
jgi:hypothetical protein